MTVNKFDDLKIHNVNHFFTELFSVLKRSLCASADRATLTHDPNELKIICQHIDNAIEVLLQGLQSLGQVVGVALSEEVASMEFQYIGFFISAMTNLIEALYGLRLDVDYELKKTE